MKKINTRIKQFVLTILIVQFSFSCISINEQTGLPIPPPRSTISIRLDDIKKELGENPAAALNLIYIFKEVYSSNKGTLAAFKLLLPKLIKIWKNTPAFITNCASTRE